MLKIKVVVVGAIVFFVIIISALFFLLPGVQSQSSTVLGSPEVVDSKAGWANARPLSITNYMQRENDLMLILKNNSGINLIVKTVCVSEEECDDRSNTVRAGSTNVSLIEVKNDCELGENFNYQTTGIVIIYTENGQEKTQNGEFPFIGTCA